MPTVFYHFIFSGCTDNVRQGLFNECLCFFKPDSAQHLLCTTEENMQVSNESESMFSSDFVISKDQGKMISHYVMPVIQTIS